MDIQLPMQSVPVTTKVMISNPTHGEVYSIHCDKVCQWLVAGRWFFPGAPVSSIKLTATITEILLKVALSTITLSPFKNQLRSYAEDGSRASTSFSHTHTQK